MKKTLLPTPNLVLFSLSQGFFDGQYLMFTSSDRDVFVYMLYGFVYASVYKCVNVCVRIYIYIYVCVYVCFFFCVCVLLRSK